MEIGAWLAAATADVRQRGLTEVEPLLQGLARLTEVLRGTSFEDTAGASDSRWTDAPAPREGDR